MKNKFNKMNIIMAIAFAVLTIYYLLKTINSYSYPLPMIASLLLSIFLLIINKEVLIISFIIQNMTDGAYLLTTIACLLFSIFLFTNKKHLLIIPSIIYLIEEMYWTILSISSIIRAFNGISHDIALYCYIIRIIITTTAITITTIIILYNSVKKLKEKNKFINKIWLSPIILHLIAYIIFLIEKQAIIIKQFIPFMIIPISFQCLLYLTVKNTNIINAKDTQ